MVVSRIPVNHDNIINAIVFELLMMIDVPLTLRLWRAFAVFAGSGSVPDTLRLLCNVVDLPDLHRHFRSGFRPVIYIMAQWRELLRSILL